MSRKSAYVGWFGKVDLPTVDTNEFSENRIEDFEYDGDILRFRLVRYTTRNVPIRYTTVNYVKHPVEWKESVRSKVLLKIDKKIILERFCEIELKNLNIDRELKLQLLDLLNYTPSWLQKEIDLQQVYTIINNEEKKLQKEIDIDKVLQDINDRFNNKIQDIEKLKSLIKLKKSSTLSLVLRIIFSLPTLFICWMGYIGKNRLIFNQNRFDNFQEEINKNEELKIFTLEETKKKLQSENKSINANNHDVEKEIKRLNKKICNIESKDYLSELDEEGFENLRKKLSVITSFSCKGVYIIWNKTKNKYYVGQSKDIYKRLFTQHFCNGDVKNVIFAKDWFDENDFYYKIIEVSTKDELDLLEKELIEKYDSFKNGYNNTGGNK